MKNPTRPDVMIMTQLGIACVLAANGRMLEAWFWLWLAGIVALSWYREKLWTED